MGVFDFFKKNKNIENENGLNEVYYNNGKGSLKQRFFQKDGIPNGMSQTFYKDGQLEEQSYWKDGLLHGNLKWYHSNGKLKLAVIDFRIMIIFKLLVIRWRDHSSG